MSDKPVDGTIMDDDEIEAWYYLKGGSGPTPKKEKNMLTGGQKILLVAIFVSSVLNVFLSFLVLFHK